MTAGSLAEWATAVIALAALVAAVWSGVLSRRLVGVEQDRDDARFATERRSQATHVHAWGAYLTRPDRADGERFSLVILNSSSLPVSDVVIRSRHLKTDEPAIDLTISVVPPGKWVFPSAGRKGWKVAPIDFELNPEPADPILRKDMVTGFAFTDATGVRWAVDEHRHLEEAPGAPAH